MATNMLAGLLAGSRLCYRDKETMERIHGDWAVPQVLRNRDGSFTSLGPVFVASLFRCPKCGAVEIVDEDRS
jgi:hypothetical protein